MTREIIVIIFLLVINICLLTLVASLCSRLVFLRRELKIATITTSDDNYTEKNRHDDGEDNSLKPTKLINNTYSELDIYSASSGFVSEGSKYDDVDSDSAKSDVENLYETAESVRLKKQAQMTNPGEKYKENKHSLTYSRAMQSIDDTLKLLKESAEKL